MIATHLINPMLPALKPTDSVGSALEWMEEMGCQQLVVVDAGAYKGIVAQEFLEEILDRETLIKELVLLYPEAYATDLQHIYELLRLAIQYSLRVIPVLHDDDLSFAGSVAVDELLERFAVALGVQERGAVLVLKIDQRDYSLADVSRHIESDGVKIISSYYATEAGTNGGEEASFLTLKLNKREVTTVVSTLERYGYRIQELYSNDPVESIDKQRLDLLLKYLET